MKYLGLAKDNAAVYEGGSLASGYRLSNAPLLIPVRFDNSEELSSTIAFDLFFREDSFDPITRIRRGRIYRNNLYSNPTVWHVHDPQRPYLPVERWGQGMMQMAEVEILSPYDHIFDDKYKKQPSCILGQKPHQTIWKIISIETSITGAAIYTLKSYRSLGEIPELNMNKIPDAARPRFLESIESLENSLNRHGAREVIDRCRDAMSVVFGAQVENLTLDLSAAIDAYVRKRKLIKNNNNNGEDMKSWAGRIVARFHSRVKPNEQEKHGTRESTEQDSQLAIRCLGLCLIEFGWANSE